MEIEKEEDDMGMSKNIMKGNIEQIEAMMGMQKDKRYGCKMINKMLQEMTYPGSKWNHMEQLKKNSAGIQIARWQAKLYFPRTGNNKICKFCKENTGKWIHYF